MPGSGVWRHDGTPLENNGQQPDIVVEMTAEDCSRSVTRNWRPPSTTC